MNSTVLKLGSKGTSVKQLQQLLHLTADGIFGKNTESAVKQFQKDHNLIPDGIVGVNTWKALGITEDSKCIDPSVIYSPLSVHISRLPNRTIKYLAIHFTAGSNSKPGKAKDTKHVFEQRKASADFCVDDRDMVQFNPDLHNYYCWAVGDKKAIGSNGGQLYGIATNRNTISIEICSTCIPATSTAVSHSNHDGWSFTDAAINNAVKLSKILMKKFNIDKDHVVRHYDISGKLCPGILGWNNAEEVYDKNTGKRISGAVNNSKEWEKFKEKLN